jgi:hypothetical protein
MSRKREMALVSQTAITGSGNMAVSKRELAKTWFAIEQVIPRDVLDAYAFTALAVECRKPVYLDLPEMISSVAADRWYAPARPHGRAFYREEMYAFPDEFEGMRGVDADTLIYWPVEYTRSEVLDMVDELIRPSERVIAVALPLAWRVGFAVGWLSGLAIAQPQEAQEGLIILTALVVPLLSSSPAKGNR